MPSGRVRERETGERIRKKKGTEFVAAIFGSAVNFLFPNAIAAIADHVYGGVACRKESRNLYNGKIPPKMSNFVNHPCFA